MGSFFFRLARVVVVLGLACLAAYWLITSKQAPDKKVFEIAAPGVTVTTVQPQTQTMVVEAYGTVVPRTRVNLAAEVGGRIAYLNPVFQAGEKVEAGDILIRIDQRSFRLDREQAAVRLAQARADLKLLSREIENLKADADLARNNMALSFKELERVRALSKNQFASKTMLDRVEQQYLAARSQFQSVENGLALIPSRTALKKAALAAARNDLAKADLVLEKSEIRAGFNGFVLSKTAELGEFVNPGQVLGAVYESDALNVDVSIPIEQIKWLQKVFDTGNMPSVEVSIANLEEGESLVWTARVARVKANIDEKTRTLPMTVEIGPVQMAPIVEGEFGHLNLSAGPLATLKPGTFVRCRIFGEVVDGLFIVPRYLLQADNTLYIVREGKLEIRPVIPFRKFENNVFIRSGLKPGDQIITSPLPGAREGMAVKVKTGGQ